jgi:hypothetical protein
VTIHYVDVQERAAAGERRLGLFRQTRKIRRQNRWRELNHWEVRWPGILLKL